MTGCNRCREAGRDDSWRADQVEARAAVLPGDGAWCYAGDLALPSSGGIPCPGCPLGVRGGDEGGCASCPPRGAKENNVENPRVVAVAQPPGVILRRPQVTARAPTRPMAGAGLHGIPHRHNPPRSGGITPLSTTPAMVQV